MKLNSQHIGGDVMEYFADRDRRDAGEALADLRELLASPLATRPMRERLLAKAIKYLEAELVCSDEIPAQA